MTTGTQRTWIATILAHVDTWRRGNRWSRESAAVELVAAHERLGLPDMTGVYFDPPSRDTFERARVNADRWFRWLDDASKSTNLLSCNELPAVLAALPVATRAALATELLGPLGLSVSITPAVGDTLSPLSLLRQVTRECAEAQDALAALADGIDPGELETAERELTEASAAVTGALHTVRAELGRTRGLRVVS